MPHTIVAPTRQRWHGGGAARRAGARRTHERASSACASYRDRRQPSARAAPRAPHPRAPRVARRRNRSRHSTNHCSRSSTPPSAARMAARRTRRAGPPRCWATPAGRRSTAPTAPRPSPSRSTAHASSPDERVLFWLTFDGRWLADVDGPNHFTLQPDDRRAAGSGVPHLPGRLRHAGPREPRHDARLPRARALGAARARGGRRRTRLRHASPSSPSCATSTSTTTRSRCPARTSRFAAGCSPSGTPATS